VEIGKTVEGEWGERRGRRKMRRGKRDAFEYRQ
jgi:hypothetical protein